MKRTKKSSDLSLTCEFPFLVSLQNYSNKPTIYIITWEWRHYHILMPRIPQLPVSVCIPYETGTDQCLSSCCCDNVPNEWSSPSWQGWRVGKTREDWPCCLWSEEAGDWQCWVLFSLSELSFSLRPWLMDGFIHIQAGTLDELLWNFLRDTERTVSPRWFPTQSRWQWMPTTTVLPLSTRD